MRQIGLSDLIYYQEQNYRDKIKPFLKNSKYIYNQNYMKKHKKSFISLMAHSIKISNLKSISDMIKQINSFFNKNFNIFLFINESELSGAHVFPIYKNKNKDECDKIIIVVSQHFLNNLNRNEQLAILAHEIGHIFLKHHKIPSNKLLNIKDDIENIQDLKSNILKWNISKEISSDILSFIFLKKDFESFSMAILKTCASLSESSIKYLNKDELIDNILNQYSDIVESSCNDQLTTHPLTPLRIKIIKTISESELINNFNQEIPTNKYKKMKDNFNKKIDNIVKKIYPEIIGTKNDKIKNVMLELGLAVILSDNKILPEEINAISKIIGYDNLSNINDYYKKIKNMNTDNYSKKINNLVQNSINNTIEYDLSKNDIFHIIRNMIIIAASDNEIEKNEIQTILKFSNRFGIDIYDLKMIAKRTGLNMELDIYFE